MGLLIRNSFILAKTETTLSRHDLRRCCWQAA
jgi:hypothetical protein